MQVSIRPLQEQDLPEADRVFRLAFGTFIGLPDPMSFMGDADLIGSRWRNDPAAALGAYDGDALVGTSFATRCGSFGVYGPLSVRPDRWDHGIAQRLLAACMELFDRWGTRQVGLFTFPHSAKHIGLYQKFGFWPQYLTPLMGKPVQGGSDAGDWASFAALAPQEREACLEKCLALTDSIYAGLDVRSEIQSVAAQQLGDTVLVYEGTELAALAVCHVGACSEAGSGSVYIKFGAARAGSGAAERFGRLLSACEALAAERGVERLVTGVNTARHNAYRLTLELGFRTAMLGVAMQRPNEPGYNRADCYVMDDWR